MRTGQTHTEETRKKMSLAKKGKYVGSNNPKWTGGREAKNARRREARKKTFRCLDCTAEFPTKRGCNSKYCPQCRVISCICSYCIKEFFIDRKNYNMGRGKYCTLECANKHIDTKLKPGAEHYAWKGGVSKQKGYGHAYKMAYRARKFKAEGTYSPQQWSDLKKKFGYMCLCCKQVEPFITLTADHIIPLSVGGSNSIDNIQPLCASCNSRKYNKIINFIKQYA